MIILVTMALLGVEGTWCKHAEITDKVEWIEPVQIALVTRDKIITPKGVVTYTLHRTGDMNLLKYGNRGVGVSPIKGDYYYAIFMKDGDIICTWVIRIQK